jgi:hypothetical protein
MMPQMDRLAKRECTSVVLELRLVRILRLHRDVDTARERVPAGACVLNPVAVRRQLRSIGHFEWELSVVLGHLRALLHEVFRREELVASARHKPGNAGVARARHGSTGESSGRPSTSGSKRASSIARHRAARTETWPPTESTSTSSCPGHSCKGWSAAGRAAHNRDN